MAAPKGHPFYGGGAPRTGRPNKTTLQVKEAISYAFDKLGGEKKLLKWAREKPENLTIFYRDIWARMLPLQVQGQISHGLSENARAELAREIDRFIEAERTGETAIVINGRAGNGAEERLAIPGPNGATTTSGE